LQNYKGFTILEWGDEYCLIIPDNPRILASSYNIDLLKLAVDNPADIRALNYIDHQFKFVVNNRELFGVKKNDIVSLDEEFSIRNQDIQKTYRLSWVNGQVVGVRLGDGSIKKMKKTDLVKVVSSQSKKLKLFKAI